MENENFTQLNEVVQYWFLPIIVGLLFILAAIWILFTSEEALNLLAIVFCLTFFFTGVLEIISSIQIKHLLSGWRHLLTVGILDIILFSLLIWLPELSTKVLTLLVGFVFLYRSLNLITWLIELRKYEQFSWGWLLLAGILCIIFSIFLSYNPNVEQLTLLIYTSFTLLMIAVSEIYLSFVLRKLKLLYKNRSK